MSTRITLTPTGARSSYLVWAGPRYVGLVSRKSSGWYALASHDAGPTTSGPYATRALAVEVVTRVMVGEPA